MSEGIRSGVYVISFGSDGISSDSDEIRCGCNGKWIGVAEWKMNREETDDEKRECVVNEMKTK